MKLPKYFAIKKDADNPLWDKYISWLNDYAMKNGANPNWFGQLGVYYGVTNTPKNGFTGRQWDLTSFSAVTEELTLEQWDEIVNGYKLPEKWYCVITEENRDILENWRKSVCSENYKGHLPLIGFSAISSHWGENSYYWASKCTDSLKCKGYQEITTEQFIKYVLKQKEMENRTISAANAQRIINVACENWKQKLAANWGFNIALSKDIEILEDFYQEMRKACTDSQNVLFDEIFGKDTNEVDLHFDKVNGLDLYDRYGSTRTSLIAVRHSTGSNYDRKAFYLNSDFNWEIKKDDQGQLCLIPTTK